MAELKWVSVLPRLPIASDFTTTAGLGTPVLVDSNSGISYILVGQSIGPIGQADFDGGSAFSDSAIRSDVDGGDATASGTLVDITGGLVDG